MRWNLFVTYNVSVPAVPIRMQIWQPIPNQESTFRLLYETRYVLTANDNGNVTVSQAPCTERLELDVVVSTNAFGQPKTVFCAALNTCHLNGSEFIPTAVFCVALTCKTKTRYRELWLKLSVVPL